mgnify:FL=1
MFEINSRGIKKGVGPYPDPTVLELIAQLGGQITLGDDAHSKTDVGLHYPEAKRVAAQFFSKAVVFGPGPNRGYLKREVPL